MILAARSSLDDQEYGNDFVSENTESVYSHVAIIPWNDSCSECSLKLITNVEMLMKDGCRL